MAYEKQTWETGQVITAEKLNHMEDGIEGAGSGGGSGRFDIFFHEDEESGYILTTTYDDIQRAFASGQTLLLTDDTFGQYNCYQLSAYIEGGDAGVYDNFQFKTLDGHGFIISAEGISTL